MRIYILLQNLMNRNGTISKELLAKDLDLSISSIRNLIRSANDVGKKNGFAIKLIKGKGYYLSVQDEKPFHRFLEQEEQTKIDVYNAKQRLFLLMFYIFQEVDYFTVEKLAEKLDVSKTTILRDFNKVEDVLKQFDLQLERKAHYGLRVVGSEIDFRRAFYEFVLTSDMYLEPTQEFCKFKRTFPFVELKELLTKELSEKNMIITDVALENVLNHIQVLVYRAIKQKIFTKDSKEDWVDDIYFDISKKLVDWIQIVFHIYLPDSEISLLAAHIAGKASVENLPKNYRKGLMDSLELILKQIDKELLTNFCNDMELKNALLLHMFPLLNRMYSNLNLNNPLIDEIYQKYANVFLIALRFGEIVERKYEFELSMDEIGYLALHFAAHFERAKNKSLERFQRIVVICSTGGGSAELLRLRLEFIFSKAIIVTSSANDIAKFKDELPDLFLTTIPLKDEVKDLPVPVIHIKELLDDSEIYKLQKWIVMSASNKTVSNRIPGLLELFDDKFFYKDDVKDYRKLLAMLSKDLIKFKYAPENFDKLVMEREEKFSTIYKNGVAGPHALKLEGIKDVVSVAVYEKPFEWKGKSVQIVFLINLQKGHLFIHQEISRLMLRIMEDDYVLKKLTTVKDFNQFKMELENLIK